MRIQTLLHPFALAKQIYIGKYVIPTEEYRHMIDTNPQKAQDLYWYLCYRKKFPWDNPVTLNEKIIWLSAMTDTSKWTECSDKYEVRKYVESLGLGHILTKCYGVWEHFDDIDFSKLPDQFVLKCTHDCGSTIIVNDKSRMNIPEVKAFLEDHLSERFGYQFCEPHYTKIKPRIMAEEILPINPDISSSLVDYKFWGCNGKVDYCMTVYDREPEEKGGSYMLDLYSVRPWKQIEGLTSHYDKRYSRTLPEPLNLDEMVKVAELLSREFPQVRVDLYNINGKVFFGELTFTSQGGRMSYYTESFQEQVGGAFS